MATKKKYTDKITPGSIITICVLFSIILILIPILLYFALYKQPSCEEEPYILNH